MKTVFFGFCSDLYYFQGGGLTFINSFKHFHPDIDLVVFRQDMIDKTIDFNIKTYDIVDTNGIRKVSASAAKAIFAKMLTKKYKKVINIDFDTVITGRLDEVLKDDWEVGGAWNYNDYENANFENITPEMYVQAGLVGSTRPEFWDAWEKANKDIWKYPRLENDILNLVIYNNPEIKKMKLKIFDKEKDYYGCKSLGREGEMYIENDELMLRGEKVKAYHHAKGLILPKLRYEHMGFRKEVVEWLYKISIYGQSFIAKGI
jgi:hypothetical protein